jgi:hypothetical protein
MLAEYLEIPSTVPGDRGAADAAVSGDGGAAEKAVPGDKVAADAAAATPLAVH